MPSSTEPRFIAVISDTHCGDALGLCPPHAITLDDGGTYRASPLQRKMWAMFREGMDEWLPLVTRGEPYYLIHNGDAIDGVHHGSTNQISHNLNDQAKIAYECFAPLVDKCKGRYWHIRGTEAHVGKSGVEEERLAQRLGAVPNDLGQHARWELWKRLGSSLIHFLHHIGVTGSQAYEATAVHKELVESYVEAARWGDEPPQVIVRSHRHRYIQTQIATSKGPAIAVVTPAFQLKTPFTYKIPGARLSQPQIGLIVLRVSDTKGSKVTESGDAPIAVLSRVWRIERPREE